jgi:hypothetical protein
LLARSEAEAESDFGPFRIIAPECGRNHRAGEREDATLFDHATRAFVEAVGALSYCNPFVPERVELERRALGDEHVALGPVWHYDLDQVSNPNLERIDHRLEPILERARDALCRGGCDESDRVLYRDAALYLLYSRHQDLLLRVILGKDSAARRAAPDFETFATDARELVVDPALGLPEVFGAEQLYAFFFQIRRAFHFTFRGIIGASTAAARLRAAVWQSVFTHDMHRYRRGLYRRMGDVTTLVTGPTGTGKELVARAVGLSRFVPFDAGRGGFVEDYEQSFFALNLSALSPTLIESELFGHRRGAFTGAIQDRVGWFEVCPPLGTVFLDEIGDVAPEIQVKLLRVLETRTFQRIGDTAGRRFQGKLVAATNRDLAVEMREGRMRADLYYRLCSDRIETPSLREQLAEPEELERVVLAVAARLVGREEAASLAEEVLERIRADLGDAYPWPGNFRELEQCIRNVMVRGRYAPARVEAGPTEALFERLRSGELDADGVLDLYTTWIYHQAGSYVEAGRRLGLDRRTVKARVDSEWLERLRGGRAG